MIPSYPAIKLDSSAVQTASLNVTVRQSGELILTGTVSSPEAILE